MSSHLRNRCSEYPIRYVFSGCTRGSPLGPWLGSTKHLHGCRTRKFPKCTRGVSFHRRHGECDWRCGIEGALWSTVPYRLCSLRWFRYPRSVNWSQCSLDTRSLLSLVVVPGYHLCRSNSLSPKISHYRMADMGRFRQYLPRGLHRGHCSHDFGPSSCGAPDWRL
jgi:hypothetical protein